MSHRFLSRLPVRLCACLQTRGPTNGIWSPIGFSGSGISLIWSSRFGILKQDEIRGWKYAWEVGFPNNPRDYETSRNFRFGLRDWRTLLEVQRRVLPTKNPGGTLTYHTSKSSNWRNKADLFILSGVLLDKEKLEAWLKKRKFQIWFVAITFKPTAGTWSRSWILHCNGRLDGKPSKAFIPITKIWVL